ncbi:MAG: 23S rRNA (uracil(1939)-C(5))-methyltransferase RlmD [Alcaligenaceae bacterium]|nr:23S rRNA (uracil(1939)-C(5))-methyltransferase RlmD [Alcaligenaceae bacterium]
MKKGDCINLTIESMSTEGMGVARHEGMVFFVQGAVTGEEVSARIVQLKKRYTVCDMVEVLSATPYLNPDYEQYQHAQGGCSIFRLSYEQQLKEKKQVIEQAFYKALKELPEGLVVHPSPQIYHYRNKAVYPAGINEVGEIDFGYYQAKSHQLTFEHEHLIEHADDPLILQAIKEFVNERGFSAYDMKRHRGFIRAVLTRVNAQNQHLVCLILNAKRVDWGDEFAAFLQERVPQVSHVGLMFNPGRTTVHLKGRVEMITKKPFYDRLGDLRYEISPNAFFQVNRGQAEKVYQRVLELAQLQPSDTAWDLYCGVGSITAFLAQQAGQVFANEVVPAAIENAKRNMALNNIHNVQFRVGTAETVIPNWLKTQKADVVVLDPPRDGADESVLATIVNAAPQRIVYVSCKPSTLARDVAYLVEHGYQLKVLEGYDFFPHTMHVESVVLLERGD